MEDPARFDADPDPTFHADADPDPIFVQLESEQKLTLNLQLLFSKIWSKVIFSIKMIYIIDKKHRY